MPSRASALPSLAVAGQPPVPGRKAARASLQISDVPVGIELSARAGQRPLDELRRTVETEAAVPEHGVLVPEVNGPTQRTVEARS